MSRARVLFIVFAVILIGVAVAAGLTRVWVSLDNARELQQLDAAAASCMVVTNGRLVACDPALVRETALKIEVSKRLVDGASRSEVARWLLELGIDYSQASKLTEISAYDLQMGNY